MSSSTDRDVALFLHAIGKASGMAVRSGFEVLAERLDLVAAEVIEHTPLPRRWAQIAGALLALARGPQDLDGARLVAPGRSAELAEQIEQCTERARQLAEPFAVEPFEVGEG